MEVSPVSILNVLVFPAPFTPNRPKHYKRTEQTTPLNQGNYLLAHLSIFFSFNLQLSFVLLLCLTIFEKGQVQRILEREDTLKLFFIMSWHTQSQRFSSSQSYSHGDEKKFLLRIM